MRTIITLLELLITHHEHKTNLLSMIFSSHKRLHLNVTLMNNLFVPEILCNFLFVAFLPLLS